jgi:hypothetical protein
LAHGGRREGAGPKADPPKARKRPGRKTDEERRERAKAQNNQTFDEKAIEALPELFDTIRAIAMGYKVAVYEAPDGRSKLRGKVTQMAEVDGTPVWVYTVPPDKSATQYLIDRAAGKAAVKNQEAAETELVLEVAMPTEDDEELDALGE